MALNFFNRDLIFFSSGEVSLLDVGASVATGADGVGVESGDNSPAFLLALLLLFLVFASLLAETPGASPGIVCLAAPGGTPGNGADTTCSSCVRRFVSASGFGLCTVPIRIGFPAWMLAYVFLDAGMYL